MNSDKKHTHAEPDHRPRAFFGVVACVQKLEDGRTRLILDDVCSDSDSWPQSWQSHWPFTYHDFESKRFLGCELDEKQLAQIGLDLVARLSALTAGDKSIE